jgi:uncharacterized membrane protein YsdA (DUF1294 family)/cold shock CspA family protein
MPQGERKKIVGGWVRHKGRITQWHDDKGYGFITPSLPGPDVFLHIKAFGQISKRPQVGELITYILSQDERGRPRAAKVAYSRDTFVPKRSRPTTTRRTWAIPLALATLAIISLAPLGNALPIEVAALYGLASALAFILYAWDKASATRDGLRTPENTLLIIGLVGGWPGALIAQEVLRHKTAKTSFQTSFWITVIVNVGVLGWLVLDPNNPVSEMLRLW